VDEVALDIDIIKRVPPPDRAFAPLAADVSNRLGADHQARDLAHEGGPHQCKIAIRGFPSAGALGRISDMRNDAWGDVWKVWLYAAASVYAWRVDEPLLYNAGKALAEVSASKTINGSARLAGRRFP
jgi:hypothetical protein